jgi:hypothetical protein
LLGVSWNPNDDLQAAQRVCIREKYAYSPFSQRITILFILYYYIIYDWSHYKQVFRFGQTKPVFIYRLVTEDTVEDKILQRQMAKILLSKYDCFNIIHPW